VAQRDRPTEKEFRKTCEMGTPEYGLVALAMSVVRVFETFGGLK
jgi:hypothetical protein